VSVCLTDKRALLSSWNVSFRKEMSETSGQKKKRALLSYWNVSFRKEMSETPLQNQKKELFCLTETSLLERRCLKRLFKTKRKSSFVYWNVSFRKEMSETSLQKKKHRIDKTDLWLTHSTCGALAHLILKKTSNWQKRRLTDTFHCVLWGGYD